MFAYPLAFNPRSKVTNIAVLLSLGAFVLLRNSGLIWLAKSESNVV